MPKQITVIVDTQFGSTGKGLLAGYLAKRLQPDTVVTAWAANAGHTFIDNAGRKFVHTMLANGIVSPKIRQVLIGAGSLINLDSLASEIESACDIMGGVQVLIHENAAIITQRHIDEENCGGEGDMTSIGSTKKGVGAAAIQRIRRNPNDLNNAKHAAQGHRLLVDKSYNCRVVSVHEYNDAFDSAEEVLVEGAQGYSLSMYHGLYPYTTSRDVTTHQILADCCVPMYACPIRVIGTARTFPIRVANRHDKNGKQIGYSGDGYPDQREISFEDIGQAQELTTVTKLPRRIFTFSKQQVHDAIRQCGISEVFLNFANYCGSDEELQMIIDAIEESGAIVSLVGWGASESNISVRYTNEEAASHPFIPAQEKA